MRKKSKAAGGKKNLKMKDLTVRKVGSVKAGAVGAGATRGFVWCQKTAIGRTTLRGD